MQRDSSTYCDEPEDGEDFEAWLAGFDLAARRPDVERLIAENTFMSELQVVPPPPPLLMSQRSASRFVWLRALAREQS